jgi:superfamily I DNA and RNA helicase
MVTRISGGLAHWARRLHFTPYRLRVSGTAGSGKTQLALAEFKAAVEDGKRPLYVCYNRPLADHFNAITPIGGLACTFHMLCDLHLQDHGIQTDFSKPGAFDQLVHETGKHTPTGKFLFDTVIIDEGQDFTSPWRDAVLRHAKPDARLIWLEDPMQNLYGKPPVELPDWVELRSEAKHRSPRAVVRFLQSIVPDDTKIEAQSPIESADIEVLTYKSPGELLERMSEALRKTYSAGFRKEDVAIITFRGRENSTLLPYDQIGQNRLRSFSGRYDLLGQPEFTEGDVLIESVYRFKGQSAPAIILAEVDFESLDQSTIRKIFVGATRATLHLTLVMSERAAQALLRSL